MMRLRKLKPRAARTFQRFNPLLQALNSLLCWLWASFLGNFQRGYGAIRNFGKADHLRSRFSQHPQALRKKPRRWQSRRYPRLLLTAVMSFVLFVNISGGMPWLPSRVLATAQLTITPITWDEFGLDSNNVTVGPNRYLSGARVCNVGTSAATNVRATFIREGAINPYINLQGASTLSFSSLPAGPPPPSQYTINYTPLNCEDFYFNLEVQRTALAYNTSQLYRIEATADGLGTISTPRPRQLYVQKILSQARNTVISFTGATTVEVGRVYEYTVVGKTATAYPQLVFSADFPNTLFQILEARTTYSLPAGGQNSTVYADACGWVKDPTSPDYHRSATTCNLPDNYASGAAGNNVTTVYTVKILSAGTATVNNLIFDFSGGSYHYNADYGTGVKISITAVNPQPADLQITKTHEGNFSTGQNNYTLTVRNNGPGTASGPITITDTLPTGFSFVSATGTNWTCTASGQTVNCINPNSLTAGATSTLTLRVAVSADAAANSNNTATVSSSTTDSNLANNRATDPTTVLQGTNLSLSKTHSPATFVAGSTGTYTLTVTNTSTFNAAGPININDPLPTGLTFVSASGTGWICTADGQNVFCTRSTGLSAGQSSAVTLTVAVAPNIAASVTNTATVSGASFEPNLSDNTANDPTPTSLPIPDLEIVKTHTGNFIQNGLNSYTITVRNVGVQPTTGAIDVTDTFPSGSGMTYQQGISGYNWTCKTNCSLGSAGPVTFTNPGPLAPGQSTTFTITVKPTATGTFINQADVTTPGDTAVGGNNRSTDSTLIVAPPSNQNKIDLRVVKTVTKIPTPSSPTINYSITVTNATQGTSGIDQARLTDLVPSELVVTPGSIVCTANSLGNGGNTSNTCGTNVGSGNNIDYNNIQIKKQGGGVTITFSATLTNANFAGSIANTANVVPAGTSASLTDENPADNISTVVTPYTAADLIVSKTHAGNFAVGVTGSYLIRVTNQGNGPTIGPLTVIDTLPNGFNFIGATSASGSAGWSCSASGLTVTCTNPNTLAAGAYSEIILRATPTQTGSDVINTVSVSTAGESNTSNNGGTDSANVGAANSDLVITKSGPATVDLGGAIAYTLTVRNQGTTPAVASTSAPITVSDPLQSGLSFISGSGPGWSCSAVGQNITCTRPSSLEPGASSTITINALVGTVTTSPINNSASVALNGETVTGNNASNLVVTTINSIADLQVTKSHTGNFLVGQSSTYTITVRNEGPSTAAGPITVTDTLHDSLTYGSASGTGWSCAFNSSTRTVSCTQSAAMSVGANSAIALVVVPTRAGSFTNTANVSSPTSDPNTVNNTGNDPTTVNAPSADLVLSKTHSGNFVVGQSGTYTLSVNNNGPTSATGQLTIVDTLPAGLSFQSSLGSGWNCSANGQTVTCTHPNSTGLDVNASSAVNLNVLVGTGTNTSSNIINTATVSNPTSDPNPANNTATDSLLASQGADLRLEKTDAGAFTVGQNGIYTLTLTNAGPNPASGTLAVADYLPDGLTFVSASGTGWVCNLEFGDTVLCTNPNSLPPNASSTITLTVNVGASSVPSVTNTADASSPTGDSNTTNNYASRTTLVNTTASGPPKLLLVKRLTAINGVDLVGFEDNTNSSDPRALDDNAPYWPTPASTYLRGKINGGEVQPNDEVEYTIYFLSTGNTAMTNVNICDLMPTHTTFVANAFNGRDPLDQGILAGADLGVAIALNSTSLPTQPTVYLTGVSDGDRGQFIPPGEPLPASCSGSNTNGAVVVRVVQSPATLPHATAPGSPANSYGFIRFRVRVN